MCRCDIDNYKFHAPLSIAEGVTLKGHYRINGRILVLPITGEGPCELNLGQCPPGEARLALICASSRAAAVEAGFL